MKAWMHACDLFKVDRPGARALRGWPGNLADGPRAQLLLSDGKRTDLGERVRKSAQANVEARSVSDEG